MRKPKRLTMDELDELKEYIQKTTKDKLLLGLSAIVFAAAAYIMFKKHMWIFFVIASLCALALFIGAVTSSSIDKKFLDTIENSPEKYVILSDFERAQSFSDDLIRMGEKYIFSQKQAKLISYEDIKKLQYVEFHDNSTGRTEPRIAVTMNNGSHSTLCDLYDNDPLALAQKICEIVLSKNPNVEIKL